MFFGQQNPSDKNFSTSNFVSPFFDEITDPSELRYSFEKLPIIPFQGTNSASCDTVLNLLHKLSEVVPFYASAVEVVKDFAVGQGWELKKRLGKGVINQGLEDVSHETIEAFEDSYLDNLYDTDLTELSSFAAKSLTIDGNLGLLISIEKLSKKAKIEFIPTQNFRYSNLILTQNIKVIVISTSFVYDFLKNSPPTFIPVYPNFQENEDGLIQTFIHIKNAVPNRKFYGLSASASSLMQQYTYNQLFTYLSAETENRFTGKVMFDSELETTDLDGDISQSQKAFVSSLKNTFTNKGTERSSVVVRSRSQGLAATEVTQFKANTEHEFYDVMNSILKDTILISLGVDKRLVADSSDAGMFGEKLEAIYMGMSKKVSNTQRLIENGINAAFQFIEEQTKNNIRNGAILKLKSVYAEMMKEKELIEKNVSHETINIE